MRSIPKNLDCEPPYPIDGMVMFSIRNPDWTGHLRHPECEIEEPHKVEDCGLWKDEPMTPITDKIKLPVRIEATKEYGGDVRTMSGGWENRFWLDRFNILDADGTHVAQFEDESITTHIATCINEHARLVSELETAKRALDQIRVHAATYKSAAKSDVRRTLNVIDDIAQAALNICQNK